MHSEPMLSANPSMTFRSRRSGFSVPDQTLDVLKCFVVQLCGSEPETQVDAQALGLGSQLPVGKRELAPIGNDGLDDLDSSGT
jgi:hypothetical protein